MIMLEYEGIILELHSLLFQTNSGLQDAGPWREQDVLAAKAAASLTALMDIPSRFFASQNRMTSFT
jgi:hypothetical protein